MSDALDALRYARDAIRGYDPDEVIWLGGYPMVYDLSPRPPGRVRWRMRANADHVELVWRPPNSDDFMVVGRVATADIDAGLVMLVEIDWRPLHNPSTALVPR